MSDIKNSRLDQAFHVSLPMHLLSGLVDRCRSFWIWMGNMESKALAEELGRVSIRSPVYVAGLARSGTTILLEFLASHPDVVTHQYRDFPLVFLPYWWRQSQRSSQGEPEQGVERTHQDGIMVTPSSPEAMEEVIWMAFFAHAHNPAASQILSADDKNSKFERFYREHIGKLLLSSGRQRYVSKGNYNFTRFRYLLKIFSDARLVAPIRHPVHHIASLMKQHKLFTAGEKRHPRALAHMRRVGHYEFGLDRRPINVGNPETVREVMELWRQGQEVRGWARYWAYLYQWFAEARENDAQLREAALIVRFEDLCNAPLETLRQVLRHCELEDAELASTFAQRIQAPTYYKPSFSDQEMAIIREETQSVAERYGYSHAAHSEAPIPGWKN